MGDLMELAERCEKAAGPQFVLETDIARTIHEIEGRMWSGLAKPYTASVDAAMSLVPEGMRLSMLSSESMAASWKASLWDMDGWKEMPAGRVPSGQAATPALALCAAALKARANALLGDGVGK